MASRSWPLPGTSPSTPLADSSRRTPTPVSAASTASARTKGWPGAIETALLKLVFGRRKGWVRINIDHVTIGNFTIAVLALQTGRGRALPFWVQVNQGPRNAAIEPLIDKLTRLLDRLAGSYPKLRIRLVGDRWFASERLMRLCQDKGITFVFRTKTDKLVQTPWGKVSIGEIANYDTLIEYKGIEMRLIISDLRPGMKEAWFLLTNDFGRSRQGLLCQYERRWEIETTFKDVKNTQDLDPCRLRQTQSLRNVLLFACCGWVLFWTAVSKRQLFAVLNRTHSHKRLSWFNYLFEWLQRQLSRPLIPT